MERCLKMLVFVHVSTDVAFASSFLSAFECTGHDQFNGPRAAWSAVRDARYGYGRLRLANHSHLHWEEIESGNGSVIDAFWMRKED